MIIPMKKAQIVVLKENKEKLLESLQKSEVMMLVSTNEKEISVDVSSEQEVLKRTDESLKIIQKYRKKPKLVREELIVDYNTFSQNNPRQLELLDLIESSNQKISELELENENLKAEIDFYKPWLYLEVKPSEIDKSKYAKIHTGFIPNPKLHAFNDYMNKIGADFEVVSSSVSESAVIFACFLDDNKEAMDFVKTLDFNEVILPKLDSMPKEIIENKNKQIQKNDIDILELKNDLKVYANEINELLVLSDKVASEVELKTAPVEETYSAVYLVGWVRSDQVDKLEKVVKKVTTDYDLEITDPQDGEVVPTATKNNDFVSSFEPITNMFSVPSVNDVDPNPTMGFWFWLIFGMMMGDAGYGLALIIIMALLVKITKPKESTLKLYKMLYYGGYATILWGALFNSIFGYTLGDIIEAVSGKHIDVLFKPILLNPTINNDDIVKYLLLSLAIGGLHLITGFIIKAYTSFKQGKFFDGFFDNFPWVFLITGIGMYFIDAVSKIGLGLAIVAVLMILLTHGRRNKNIFAKIGGGLYSLYTSVNIFSDILSYSRILALSLSSAIIGMVMNILAEMMPSGIIGGFFALLIYIVGHTFNLVMGLLSAYVHDSRLQYIEFFGKFYEGGGIEFKPLSMNLKHIDKIEKVEI